MDRTKISWADSTWNVVTGCDPVSDGCRHCYAARYANRGIGDFRVDNWDDGPRYQRPFSEVRTHPDRLEVPLHWRKPQKIFVCSMGDLFHESVPFTFIHELWDIMKACPQHTFQILTKRPARMKECVDRIYSLERMGWAMGFWRHVWLGVTAENQEMADKRIPILMQISAAVRFVSCEPLLSSIDIRHYMMDNPVYEKQTERGICISVGDERGSGDPRRWNDLADSEEGMGSMEEGGDQPTLQDSEGGTRLQGILPSQNYDRRGESLCLGSSASVAPLQRTDSGRTYSESQGRKEEAQSSGQSGIGHKFGTTDSCNPCSKSGSCLQPERDDELHGEIDGRPGCGDPAEKVCGRGSKNNCQGLRNSIPDGFSHCSRRQTLDLVICGGETGPGARLVHPDWVRTIRDQCLESNVPFHFKSWGEWIPDGQFYRSGREDDFNCQKNALGHTHFTRVGKKYAGRMIDGKEYLQFPREVAA